LSSSSIPPTFERNTIPFHPSIAHTTASLKEDRRFFPPTCLVYPPCFAKKRKKEKEKLFLKKALPLSNYYFTQFFTFFLLVTRLFSPVVAQL
jgi:hypothetical protein